MKQLVGMHTQPTHMLLATAIKIERTLLIQGVLRKAMPEAKVAQLTVIPLHLIKNKGDKIMTTNDKSQDGRHGSHGQGQVKDPAHDKRLKDNHGSDSRQGRSNSASSRGNR